MRAERIKVRAETPRAALRACSLAFSLISETVSVCDEDEKVGDVGDRELEAFCVGAGTRL